MGNTKFVRRRFLAYFGKASLGGALLSVFPGYPKLKAHESSSKLEPSVDELAAASGIVSVLDFGAIPGGLHDATDAFQKAIDFAHNGAEGDEKGTVFVPPGRYKIDVSRGLRLHDGTQIVGSGISETELIASSGAEGAMMYRPYQHGHRTHYVQIKDLRIVLFGSQQVGIDLSHVGRSLIERCYITTQTRYEEKTYRQISRKGGIGIKMQVTRSGTAAQGYVGGEVNTVRDCYIVAMNTGILVDGGHGHLIDRCEIMEVVTGIKSLRKEATSLKVRSCTIQYAHGGYCLELAGEVFVVDGCYFEMAKDSAGVIHLLPGSRTCSIKGNIFVVATGTSNQRAIRDQGVGTIQSGNLIK